MPKLILLVLTLLPLLNCSGPQRIPPALTPQKCRIAEIPEPPKLNPSVCGSQVCLTPADVAALVKWVAAVAEARVSIAGCPLVTK